MIRSFGIVSVADVGEAAMVGEDALAVVGDAVDEAPADADADADASISSPSFASGPLVAKITPPTVTPAAASDPKKIIGRIPE
jgi:hypothetical protein